MAPSLLPQPRRCSRWAVLLCALLGVLFITLTLRAHDQLRWSDWGFGDAQTMLSLRQWQEGGWLNNHLLFKPQGYASVIDLLDQPELRHHAHGTSTETSPRVGPRLLYTHYPAGYLLPYAVLFKLGITSIFAQRLLSILFSVGALALMYRLFALLVSPRVAWLAVLFYSLSSSFLGFADSLANQPLDDLLRFAFMVAVVRSTRAETSRARRRWSVTAWGVQFMLSLSSFDSVFFLYIWLIGWDLLERRGFRWQRYLLHALAPLLAHSLQFAQNSWYLGVSDAWRDICDTFTLKHGTRGAGQGGRIGTVVLAVMAVCYMVYSPGVMLVVILGVYLLGYRRFRGSDPPLPSPRLLLLLFLCGVGFEVVLPRAALISSYEGRQLIPFAALLVSGFTWLVVDGVRALMPAAGERVPAPTRERVFLGVAVVVLLFFWGGFARSNRFDRELSLSAGDMALARALRAMPVRHDPVYFAAGGFDSYLDPDYVSGYPQIRPETEYYAGSRLILCFANPQLLARDLALMVGKAATPFSPVVVTDRPETMARVLHLLLATGVVAAMPDPAGRELSTGRGIADLTPVVRWPAAMAMDDPSGPLPTMTKRAPTP